MITKIKYLVPKNEIQIKNISKATKKGIFDKGQFIIIDNKHLYEIVCFYWGAAWWRNDRSKNDLLVGIRSSGSTTDWDVNDKRLKLFKRESMINYDEYLNIKFNDVLKNIKIVGVKISCNAIYKYFLYDLKRSLLIESDSINFEYGYDTIKDFINATVNLYNQSVSDEIDFYNGFNVGDKVYYNSLVPFEIIRIYKKIKSSNEDEYVILCDIKSNDFSMNKRDAFGWDGSFINVPINFIKHINKNLDMKNNDFTFSKCQQLSLF